MLNGNKKLKLKNRNTKTPNIIENKNVKLFVEPKIIINNVRPHSKYILKKNKGSNHKISFPIKINNKQNNDGVKMNMNNIYNININNQNNNLQPKIIPFQQNQKIFRIGNFSEGEKKKAKRIFLGSGDNLKHDKKGEKDKNNIIEVLSKSLKKNNHGQNNMINQFNHLYDSNEKNPKNIKYNNNNKIILQNNIKRINLYKKEDEIKKILPLLNKDIQKHSAFSEEHHFKPDNIMPNQLHLVINKNNKKDFGKKQNMNIIKPLNPKNNQIFINKNFKNNKKNILIVNKPEINKINNIFNININTNIVNNHYIVNNNLGENKNIILKNRKNNIIENRQNNFKIKDNNKNDNNKNNKYKIKKSIDNFFIKKNNNNNNLIGKNNLIVHKIQSSSEEPIIIGHNKLKSGKKNNNENNNIENNNNDNDKLNRDAISSFDSEKCVKIIDYYCKEEQNANNNDTMEDFTLIKHPFFSKGNNNLSLFAVFDGHGGLQIAEFLKNNYSQHLLKTINKEYTLRFREILKNSIETIDKNLENLKVSEKCGSTGTFIIVNNNNIYCANVGDSKCYYINDKEAIQLTEDHNCKNEKEVELLKSKGAIIFRQRVYGSLSLTRSFGDLEFKQYGVTAIPYITKINADKNNVKYIIIASDGIWDAVNDKDLFKISKELKGGTSEEFCNNLVNYALEKGSNDNISCIVIRFG